MTGWMRRSDTVRVVSWYLSNWLGPLQVPVSQAGSLYRPSVFDTNHFHSNILCMRTGRIFFIKKIWWNGRIPRQRGFFGVDSSGYDNPAAIIVSAWGRKEWAWSKEVDWGFTVRDWNTSVVLLGYFIAMPIPPPQARQLLFVIGTSSYHRLKCWALETDLEFKKPSQKNGCWNINIYNLSFFFYYQIWITHSSNFSLFFPVINRSWSFGCRGGFFFCMLWSRNSVSTWFWQKCNLSRTISRSLL